MTEQNPREVGSSPEYAENPEYAALQIAMDEEDSLMRQIDHVFATTQDREEAERIILKKLAPQMDEALKKTREAHDRWIVAMK